MPGPKVNIKMLNHWAWEMIILFPPFKHQFLNMLPNVANTLFTTIYYQSLLTQYTTKEEEGFVPSTHLYTITNNN